jgi:hypothetical protein
VRGRTKAALLLVGASSTFGLVACTHAGPGLVPAVTHTEVMTRSPSVIPTRPVAAGPTTSTTRQCPLVPLAVAVPIIGQRLDHTTVQASGGKTVGCKFYPITTGLARSEHLPTNGFPSARITLTTYPSAESARQVLAIVSRAGGSPSLQSINGLVAETFQTHFYPPDGAADWACAFIKGPKLITVLLAESTGQGQANAVALAEAFASKV